MTWRARALCAQTNPESFFPEIGKPALVRDAKKVCGSCEVRMACLNEALENDEEFGIWGGLTPRERTRLANTTGEVTESTTCALDGCEDPLPFDRPPHQTFCTARHRRLACERRQTARKRAVA